MNTFYWSVALLGLGLFSAQAQSKIYVNAAATGTKDGTSWLNAYDSLSVAIRNASDGDSIFVRGGGTFKPTTSLNRDSSFTIRARLYIYGGFAGDETGDILGQRPDNFTKPILSGDIGTAISQWDNFNDVGFADNSYHVVAVPATGAGSVLDGFVVQGGVADGPTTAQRRGGGVYALGDISLSYLEVRFDSASGRAAAGGGLYMDRGTITHSKVYRNIASTPSSVFSLAYGGGVYIDRGTMTHCNIYHNTASTATSSVYGGGVYVGSGTMTHCNIYHNTASGTDSSFGGGLYMDYSGSMSYCDVYHNTASATSSLRSSSAYGGGVLMRSNNSTMTRSNIYHNTASATNSSASGSSYAYGGGLFMRSNSGAIAHCNMYRNTASAADAASGGGVYVERPFTIFTIMHSEADPHTASDASEVALSTSVIMSHCHLYHNTASSGGGARMGGTMIHCEVYHNTGGGVFMVGTMTHCEVYNNRGTYGGGVYLYRGASESKIVHSALYNNRADSLGGGVYMEGGQLLNTTLYGNSADDGNANKHREKGGGIYIPDDYPSLETHPLIANTLIYGNRLGSGTQGAQVYNVLTNLSANAPIFTHNLVQGASETAAIKGANGHQMYVHDCVWATTSPFASTDATSDTFLRLKTASAALDKGDDRRVASLVHAVDLAGHPRKAGSAVDIGAYEGAFAAGASLTDIRLSASAVTHLTAAGTEVATLSASHEGLGDNPRITYSIKDANTAADTFKVEGNKIKTNKVIDFIALHEAHSPITLVASHTPQGGSELRYEKDFVIAIRPPTLTSIALSGNKQVADGAVLGTVVGTLSATGTALPADGSGIAYQIAGGDISPSTFAIDGNQLKVIRPPVRAFKGVYQLNITAHYGSVRSAAVRFTITITQPPNLLRTPFSSALNVYPNPTKDKLRIVGLKPGEHLRLLDAKGKVLLVRPATQHLDLSPLPAGVYILEVSGKHRTPLQRRLLKGL